MDGAKALRRGEYFPLPSLHLSQVDSVVVAEESRVSECRSRLKVIFSVQSVKHEEKEGEEVQVQDGAKKPSLDCFWIL